MIDSSFTIVIQPPHFYFIPSPMHLPTHDHDLMTLRKIDYIVRHQFSHSPLHLDGYSSFSRADQINFLYQKSVEIKVNHRKKQEKSKVLFQNSISQEIALPILCRRIENTVFCLNRWPLPSEVIQHIFSYLPVSTVGSLIQLNDQGRSEAVRALITRSQKYGYRGKNTRQALLYLKDLFSEIKIICKKKLILESYLCRHANQSKLKLLTWTKIDYEKTLLSLNSLTFSHLVKLIKKTSSYSSSLPLSYALLIEQAEQYLNQTLNFPYEIEDCDSKGCTNLMRAIAINNEVLICFLLNCGVNTKLLNVEGFSSLHVAIHYKHYSIMHLLLKEKGRELINVNCSGFTPLIMAIQERDSQAIQILLEYGASTTILYRGQTILSYARQVCHNQSPIISLLLEYGAQ